VNLVDSEFDGIVKSQKDHVPRGWDRYRILIGGFFDPDTDFDPDADKAEKALFRIASMMDKIRCVY